MISHRSQYKFNTETLDFVEVKISPGKRFLQYLVHFICANLIAILFLYIFICVPSLPVEKFHASRINKYDKDFVLLVERADSIAGILHKVHFTDDQLFRNILEMDSLPGNIRYAGRGGSEPLLNFSSSMGSEIFSKLLQKVDMLKIQLKIQNDSYNEILKTAISKKELLSHFPAITPINYDKYIWISSYYGSRQDPFTFIKRTHKGIDFVGPSNTNIYATAEGTVTLVKHSRKGYGNEVVIDHGYGYSTRYAHLNKILVDEGQDVKRGQKIGLMGNTGRSTGTHLHYEVRIDNTPVNPIHFFADDLSPAEFEKLTKKSN
ncbi:MAG: M23 family metallopeptidase [Bacteroidales bacterium]|nr:M23 family metallopeptidase [Bacteroidales bacterium]